MVLRWVGSFFSHLFFEKIEGFMILSAEKITSPA
jgi:hypothetical protein